MFNPHYENLPNFKSFVARQPAEKKYPYTNSMDCACAQYLKDAGQFTDSWLSEGPQMVALNELARGDLNPDGAFKADLDWTFGKLLDRINAKEKELA